MNTQLQLKAITLKSYRGFRKEATVEFDENLTILIGVNGAGKTTVLDAVADFLLWFRNEITGGRIERYLFPVNHKTIKNDNVNNEEKGFENNLAVQLNLPDTDDFPVATSFSTAAYTDTNVDVQDYEDRESLQIFTDYFSSNELGGTLANVPVLIYYGGSSVTTDFQPTAGLNHVSEIFDTYHNSLEKERFNFQQFFNWFDKQQKIQLQRKSSIFLNNIKEAIAEMLADENTDFTNLRIEWGEQQDEMVIDKTNRTSNKTEQLSINQLSSGEKTLLALVADLAFRLSVANPKEEKPLHGTGIVLIDEIDLHLHPKWQRKVVPKLRSIFPNLQFIMTTHSPFVIASVEPQHIRMIVEDNPTENRTVLNADEENKYTKGLQPNRVLREIMGAPLRDFETQQQIKKLKELLDQDDTSTEFNLLLSKLTQNLGVQDPLIMRINHELRMRNRRKTPTA